MNHQISPERASYTPKFLTREEFDSLVEFAVTRPTPNIPAAHLTRLTTLGYVAVMAKGLVVTCDGLVVAADRTFDLLDL